MGPATDSRRHYETGAGSRQTLPDTKFWELQRDAYEKTLRELQAIDADDDDEWVQIISDWIVEHVRDKDKLPGSRAVRRRAAAFCRTNRYEIWNDEWHGV